MFFTSDGDSKLGESSEAAATIKGFPKIASLGTIVFGAKTAGSGSGSYVMLNT